MSKVFMLSSLVSGLLMLGAASYKSLEVVQDSRCRTFPERCAPAEAIATTPQDSSLEATSNPASE